MSDRLRSVLVAVVAIVATAVFLVWLVERNSLDPPADDPGAPFFPGNPFDMCQGIDLSAVDDIEDPEGTAQEDADALTNELFGTYGARGGINGVGLGRCQDIVVVTVFVSSGAELEIPDTGPGGTPVTVVEAGLFYGL